MVFAMNKKLSMKETMKPIIGALKEGKKAWSDLKVLKAQKAEIPDKTLDRLLKNLEYWGLAKKESDYWVWYENARVFNSKGEYDLAIEHSRNLVPALKNMINVFSKYRDSLYSYAREHLKAYPKIDRPLEEFEKIFNEQNEKLLQKYAEPVMQRLSTNDPFMVIPFIFTGTPRDLENLKIDNKLMSKLKPIFERYSKNYRQFSEGLSLLTVKIDQGTPLDGTCPICPKVEIMES